MAKGKKGKRSDRDSQRSNRADSQRSAANSHRTPRGSRLPNKSSRTFLTLTPRSSSNGGGTSAEQDALIPGLEVFKSKVYPGEGMYKGALDASGKRDGMGAFFHVNGNRYQGEWRADRAHGKGKMSYKDGSAYEGDWKDGRRHGIGTLTYASDLSPKRRAHSYEGRWEEDLKHGRGKLVWFGGEVYEGDFFDGAMTGEGRYSFGARLRLTSDVHYLV